MNIKKICKIVSDILRNPKVIRFEVLDKLLKEFGFKVRQPRGGSSHYIYKKENEENIVVPYKRPYVKEWYVKEIIKKLKLEVFYNENCRKKWNR